MKRMFATALFIFAAVTQVFAVEKVKPIEVHAAVEAGDMVLVDIRRPDEWASTGIAANAHALDMTSETFADDVNALIKSNRGKKLAFICQSGGRSSQLANELEAAGLQGIVDVAGGMAGNGEDAGWIAEGLPVSQP